MRKLSEEKKTMKATMINWNEKRPVLIDRCWLIMGRETLRLPLRARRASLVPVNSHLSSGLAVLTTNVRPLAGS